MPGHRRRKPGVAALSLCLSTSGLVRSFFPSQLDFNRVPTEHWLRQSSLRQRQAWSVSRLMDRPRHSFQVLQATTTRPPSQQIETAEERIDPIDYVAQEFETLYNRALCGKPAQLKALFGPGSRWLGLPLAGKDGDVQEAFDIIDQARSTVLDPRMVVTDTRVNRTSNQVLIDWQLSGTWPLPYRPRIQAAGTSTVSVIPTIDGERGTSDYVTISSIQERWDRPWWQTLLQLLPRSWDIWHLYLTPPAEKPLYRTLHKYDAVEVREYYPRVAIELEVFDSRPDVRFTEYAWVLPDFAFTNELKLQGRAQFRETYVTTSPIETCVESLQWTPPKSVKDVQQGGEVPVPAKRIRWHVPLPTHLGFNTTAFASPQNAPNATEGEAGRYIRQGRRFIALRPFTGQLQSEGYLTARRWLLSWVQKEGLRTIKNEAGKSKIWVYRNNMKAGFNMAGEFCLGIYEQPRFSDAGEIAVEVEDPRVLGV